MAREITGNGTTARTAGPYIAIIFLNKKNKNGTRGGAGAGLGTYLPLSAPAGPCRPT